VYLVLADNTPLGLDAAMSGPAALKRHHILTQVHPVLVDNTLSGLAAAMSGSAALQGHHILTQGVSPVKWQSHDTNQP
jgi:hypothetical protein